MRRQDVKSRSGVALIIVLGLVAILMIVCVSFTINMRVERAGAANLRHGTVANQIVKGALASAIATIDDAVDDRAVPDWYNTNDFSSAYYVVNYKDNNKTKQAYYWNGTLASRNGENADERLSASFFSAEVEKYFPPGMAYKGYATKYFPAGTSTGGTDIKQPEWIPVYADKASEKDDDDQDKKKSSSGAGKEVIGRYAFIAMDTSGLLDLGRIGRSDCRWMGRDPVEIQFKPELFASEFGYNPAKDKVGGKEYTQAVKAAKEFLKKLEKDGRYESFAEFRAMSEADGINVTNCFSFNTFSFDPVANDADGKIDISSVAKIKENRTKIIEAFYDCGLKGGAQFGNKDCEQARWAYLGLLDYVDEDSNMEDDNKIHPWQRPATEDIPLMAGFIAKITLQCREKFVQKTNPESGAQYWEKEPKKCEFRVAGDFKIPFARLQHRPKGDSNLSIEGKVRIGEWRMPGSVPKQVRDLFKGLREKVAQESNNLGESTRGGASLHNLKIESCAKGDDWTVIDEVESVPFSLEGVRFNVMAAGATKHKNDVLHRYPLDSDKYNDSESGLWMAVPFDCAQNEVKFEDGDVSTDEVGKNAAGVALKRTTWTKEVVVWAEFLDPRFACMEMEDGDDVEVGASTMFHYHMSHADTDIIRENRPQTIPVTKFKDYAVTREAFKDFNNAVTPKEFDDDELYGGYFGRNMPGASPVAWYMLEHPYVSREFYKFNVDGIRVSDDDDAGTTNTTDPGEQKWLGFVKNGPIESVGELGYLPIGPWYTIRLYDYDNEREIDNARRPFGFLNDFALLPGATEGGGEDGWYDNFHPVLNHFYVTNALGRVNINTAGENAIASAFCDMPLGIGYSYAHGKSKEDILGNAFCVEEAEDAQMLAQALVACRQEEAFEELADLGFIYVEDGKHGLYGKKLGLAAEAVANTCGADYGEFEREDVIRNSCGLFTTRGQSFVIAVRGESYSPMYGRETSMEGGSINAAKTAVAQIWRDTVRTDDSGSGGKGNKTPHPIFVQFFKILDD